MASRNLTQIALTMFKGEAMKKGSINAAYFGCQSLTAI